ncbi:MAG: zinc ribbon domain-containing protein [Clostridia bacterium]|nr:zinc ribbon domain-containing protein [Clostridia bacterium]
MVCRQCGTVLPDESHFCPYCMDKFDNKTETKKSNKTIATIIIILLLLVLTAIIIKLFRSGENNNQSISSQASVSSTTGKPQTTSRETATAEIDVKYYEPGTYYWNINGEGEIVLEDFENYPF